MAQAAPAVRDGFRPTRPRDPGAEPVTSTYSSLARTVRDAHLIPGLRIIEQPALLRQFRSKLAPVTH